MNSKNVISLLLVIFGLCQSAKSAFTTQQKKRNNCPTDVGDFIDILRTKRHKCEILVGYHGSCSPFKSSLEERIEIISENEFPGQLGRRFYTSDTAKSAFSKSGLKYISNTAARIPTIQKPWELGQAACTRYQSSQRTTGLSTEDIQPIVCSIYADVSTLPRLPKTYIPSYLPVPSDSQEVQPRDKTLYYDEKAMLEYERIVRAKRNSDNEFSHLNPIRITKECDKPS
ncbi:hypothetical protein BKA69DRAFT_1127519 [Paraphysoderma sedebokerense]|nr:hypothetical protein BKA69DRAFT_1127519 [Paraphysoderma sedebokerense]